MRVGWFSLRAGANERPRARSPPTTVTPNYGAHDGFARLLLNIERFIFFILFLRQNYSASDIVASFEDFAASNKVFTSLHLFMGEYFEIIMIPMTNKYRVMSLPLLIELLNLYSFTI